MAIALGILAKVIRRNLISRNSFSPECSSSDSVLLLLFSATCRLFFMFGRMTRPKRAQQRQSKAKTLLQPLYLTWSSNEDIKGAIKKVSAPDPHTHIPIILGITLYRCIVYCHLLQKTSYPWSTPQQPPQLEHTQTPTQYQPVVLK